MIIRGQQGEKNAVKGNDRVCFHQSVQMTKSHYRNLVTRTIRFQETFPSTCGEDGDCQWDGQRDRCVKLCKKFPTTSRKPHRFRSLPYSPLPFSLPVVPLEFGKRTVRWKWNATLQHGQTRTGVTGWCPLRAKIRGCCPNFSTTRLHFLCTISQVWVRTVGGEIGRLLTQVGRICRLIARAHHSWRGARSDE